LTIIPRDFVAGLKIDEKKKRRSRRRRGREKEEEWRFGKYLLSLFSFQHSYIGITTLVQNCLSGIIANTSRAISNSILLTDCLTYSSS